MEKKKEKINEKKEKIGEKKLILKKKEKKKKKREKLEKKTGRRNTVDYCCNPHYFVCGGTVIPPHDLDIVVKTNRQI